MTLRIEESMTLRNHEYLPEIELTEEQQKCIERANSHWDTYFVDVQLADGRIFYNLTAREKQCLEPANKKEATRYRFTTSEIAAIRPARFPLLRWLLDPWYWRKLKRGR